MKTRDGKRRAIYFCYKCDFYFFGKNYSHLIINDKFENSRLKTANLNIPDIKTDFENGIRQSDEYVKKFIRKSDYSKDILEIGCSWGYFLKLLKNRGINVTGLEINPVRANYVNRNLGILCYRRLEDIEQKKITFHKIFLFYVIQYIQNPRQYFKRLLNLLGVGGTICIITPNIDDVLIKIWKNKEYVDFFFEKMTVAYYSIKALRRLMSTFNHTESISFQIETEQGYSFLNHLNWYFTGKPRTTGIVGGDKYVFDISNKLSSAKARIGSKLSNCIKKFDREYRFLIEKNGFGNRIILRIKKEPN